MGAKLSTLSKSPCKDCIKPKQNRTRSTKTFKRKKINPIGKTLGLAEDWILSSPESKQSKKKVHPCSTKFRAGGRISISELAKESLCLMEKTKNHIEKDDEGLSSNCSLITGKLCGKSQKKRVDFQLPHTIIFYPKEETFCGKEEQEEEKEESWLKGYYDYEEDSFSSTTCTEVYSFDSTEEPILRLAVDILPHVFVSSKVSN